MFVVVTGGATGIGRAVAERFRADGDEVVITGRREELLRQVAAEIGARAVVCDGADPLRVSRLLAELPERVDVLVNNAGGNTDFDAPGRFAAGRQEEGAARSAEVGKARGAEVDKAGGAGPGGELSGELERVRAGWLANLEANLLTAVLTTTALGPRLTTAVVHLGSIAGARGAGSYGASKAALAMWNADVAAELGERGITSNVVAPGYTADTEFFRDRMTPERRESLLNATMTKRDGTVGDIAATVHFLASPGARHLTGQVLHVNGGALITR